MDDASQATDRIVTLLREDHEAIAYLVGYLSYGKPTEHLVAAVDSWFRHQEQLNVIVRARQFAREAAQEQQE